MKIRTGFVSNSSSSSFCLYGVSSENIDVDATIEKIKKIGIKIADSEDIDDLDELDLRDLFEKDYRTGKTPTGSKYIEYHNAGDDYFYIGRSWLDLKDDETGKQFKDKVKEELDKYVVYTHKPDSVMDSYYD